MIHIMQNNHRKTNIPSGAAVLLCFALLSLPLNLKAQVINNNNAAIYLTTGVVMSSKDAFNSTAGFLQNNGTFNLSGNYTSTGTTGGNGTYSLMGNWTNTGGIFIPGSSTVIFNGSANQSITKTGGETFNNLSIINSGAASSNWVIIANNINISGILSMSLGNIDAGTYLLFLTNPAAASLSYTSTTGSRILGKFERAVAETGNYLFPLGTTNYYNPANLKPNNVLSSGTILSQFFTAPAPGNTGLPLSDPPVEIFSAFQEGYWNLTSNGFSTGNFNINLNGTGFIIDTVTSVSRVLKRTNGGNWIIDGTHSIADTARNVVYRNNLTTNISSLGTQFAIGRAHPLIIDHPHDTIVCEDTDPVFTVKATGAQAFKYVWYKEPGVAIPNNDTHYSGARTGSLTIHNVQLADAGQYYCIVTDRYKNSTKTDDATLTVNKIPEASATPDAQDHECSNIAFTDVLLGETYGVPGSSYVWTRDNPTGIISLVPMSGTVATIGGIIPGMFNNTTDAPVTVTFTVTPIGPAPTYCVGVPIYATITVNPTPRIVPVNVKPAICFGGTTEITLTTPTVMTNGSITFDYTVSITGAPGELIGNIAPANNQVPGQNLVFQYQNYSDTLQSVYYSILPRNIASGCFDGVIVVPEVKVHPQPLQSMYISTPLTCAGGSDASITVILAKGSKPDLVDYIGPGWAPPRTYYTNSNITTLAGLITGWHQITIEDNLGCYNTDSRFISGAELDSYFTVLDKTNGYGTTCPESEDGILGLKENVSSTGVAPFEYWIVNSLQDTVRHGTLAAINTPLDTTYNLAPGNYKLYINDSNGCVNINYPEVNIVPPDAFTVSFNKYEYAGGNNISCLGYNDGSVKIDTIYGGSGGYTYKWSTTNGTITGPDNLDHLDNLTAGTYYLTTTDVMGCIKVDSVVMTQPAGMVLAGSEISWSKDHNYNISCNGGNDGYIKLTIGGGSGIFNYAWTGPASFNATTKDITGLSAGTYTCVVTDVNGCILTPNPTFTLTEPALLTIASVPSLAPDGSNNINCYGGTGSINITVTGGSTGNYKYTWSTTDGSGIVQGAGTQSSLTAGAYHLIVKDSNNCYAVADITLKQSPRLAITLAPKHITCFPAGFSNGEVNLTVSGGVAPFTYNWSNGATTEDITGLTEGYYRVRVTDLNGCQVTDSARVNTPPPLLYTKTLSNHNGYGFNVSCYGLSDGTISIATTSGTAPFSYSWQGPDGYISTDSLITGLKAGPYTLTITDSLQCAASEIITVTQPAKLGMNVTLSQSTAGGFNINCAGDKTGTIDIIPVNQVGVVEYLWSDGATTRNRIWLGAGDYRLIITDSNLCFADSTMTLTEPDSMYLVFTKADPWCADKPDGSIHIDVTGGVVGTDYTYKWSDNSTSRDVTNIQAGIYKVTVTDLNGCSLRDSLKLVPQNETCLIIPNAISPNGDLINDVWNIGLKELYPKMEIKVFNRWGESVWRSEKGYPSPWDGTSNGKPLPVDSYHYIIDFGDGRKPQVGNITIVR
jgi:gliding motility-associated-like protein